MVMRVEPIASAIDVVNAERPGLWRILMTPQGEVFDQSLARDLAKRSPGLMLIAGRYEGIDERVRSLVDQEISVGDYVLSGGEIPPMTVVEAGGREISRGVLKPRALPEENVCGGTPSIPP